MCIYKQKISHININQGSDFRSKTFTKLTLIHTSNITSMITWIIFFYKKR